MSNNEKDRCGRIKIPLQDGLMLVVEQNTDPNYKREVFIGIELDRDGGVPYQDLAIVRSAYRYDDTLSVVWERDKFEVLVFSDKDDDNYTHKFSIGLREDVWER